MQQSASLLMDGIFENNNSSYQAALGLAIGLIIPNWSYQSLKHFDSYIDSYNKKSEWGKLLTRASENPWLYFDYFSGNYWQGG